MPASALNLRVIQRVLGWHFDWAIKHCALIVCATVAQHHHGVSRSADGVVCFLHNQSGLGITVVSPDFIKPGLIVALEYFPSAPAHSVQHLEHSSLDRGRAVLEGRVGMHHVEPGLSVLVFERNTSTG